MPVPVRPQAHTSAFVIGSHDWHFCYALHPHSEGLGVALWDFSGSSCRSHSVVPEWLRHVRAQVVNLALSCGLFCGFTTSKELLRHDRFEVAQEWLRHGCAQNWSDTRFPRYLGPKIRPTSESKKWVRQAWFRVVKEWLRHSFGARSMVAC